MKLIIRDSKTHNHVFLPRKIELLESRQSCFLGKRHIDVDSDYYKTLLPSEIEELKEPCRVRKSSTLAIVDESHYDTLVDFNKRMNDFWTKYNADACALEKEFKSFLKSVDEK